MQSKNYISDLLRTFGYSYEAIAFVSTNYERYLPAVATLCNLAAKVSDQSYYDLKDTMLDEMSSVANQMGWRTFQSYDGATEGFPYIFYVDSGIFPQVSFHTDTPRSVNHRGKWSGISVQEIAPKLIANRLKKDGFNGEVYDLKLLTLNLMQGADVAEATHLHKGTEYNFVVNNNALLVLQNNIEVEPSKALLQSFMTRLAKQEKSLLKDESKNGSENSNELFSPNQEAETNDTHESGTSKATVKGLSEGVGKTTQKTEASESEYDSSEEESSNEESDFTDANGISNRARNEFDDSINNHSNLGNTDLLEQAGDLELMNDEFQNYNERSQMNETDVEGNLPYEANEVEFEKPSSLSDLSDSLKEKANAATQISSDGESLPKKGSDKSSTDLNTTFLDSLQSLSTKRSSANDFVSKNDKRTFDEHSFKGKVIVSTPIANVLQKLASGESLSLKKDGYAKFDARKVVKALTTSPHKLLTAKYDRPKHKTYFFVDTNCKNCGNEHCSWVNYSEFSAMLIETARNSENIEVWSGSKCRPERNEKTQKQEIKKHRSFHLNLEEWIKRENPENGSTFVFWGECYNISIEAIALKKVMRNYNGVWLDSLKECNSFFKQWKNRNEHNEPSTLQNCGIRVIKNCHTKEGFTRGINSIL